jgi:hypothetical protein
MFDWLEKNIPIEVCVQSQKLDPYGRSLLEEIFED